MRRLLFLSLPLFAGALLLTGCGKDEVEDVPTESRVVKAGPAKGKGSKAALEDLDAPTTGTLRGKVIFDGTPPAETEIKAMATHNDHAVCLAGPEREKVEQTWLVDPKTKGVSDVFIKLVPPAGKKFKSIEPTQKEVLVDQPFCAFVPHVQVIKPGQILKVTNSSGANHNTKIETDPSVQEGKNLNIPPGKSELISLQPQKQPVSLSCQVHSWMSGKVYVADSPYVAVTKEDGSFEIPNVPVGVELVVVMMHDDAEVDGGKTGTKHTFKAGDNELTFKVSAKK
jgi:plastocyanin